MFDLQVTQTAMELLPLVCVSLLTWSGTTFAAENEPKAISMEEGSDVTLPCSLSSKQSISSETFEWKKDDQKQVFLYNGGIHSNNDLGGQDVQFRGRVSHFPDELKSGNASIIIRNTKVMDSGNYTCDFPDIQKRQIFHIKLVVGAAPEPSVMILNQTKDWALLRCAVKGAFPKPEVHWEDSDGNIVPAENPQESERGGRYYITLQTTVTKTDYYRCVATQKEIYHQIYAETYVHMNEQTGFSHGAFIGGVLGALILGFGLGAGFCILQRRKKNGGADYKNSPEEEP